MGKKTLVKLLIYANCVTSKIKQAYSYIRHTKHTTTATRSTTSASFHLPARNETGKLKNLFYT